jgi:hypothetical protein
MAVVYIFKSAYVVQDKITTKKGRVAKQVSSHRIRNERITTEL